jgi:hypothetical protein
MERADDLRLAKRRVSYLTPEAEARVRIDAMVASAGWAVQDSGRVNLVAAFVASGFRRINGDFLGA